MLNRLNTCFKVGSVKYMSVLLEGADGIAVYAALEYASRSLSFENLLDQRRR